MTQENKELLLKDLCARLPYYPKCEMIDELRVVNNEKDSSYISTLFPKHIELFSYHNNFTIKPYLRPMSSMTEEEKEEIISKCMHTETEEDFEGVRCDVWGIQILDKYDTRRWDNTIWLVSTINMDAIDWLNVHHFDYRGLIEKGLAIEVTEDNNPYKE